MPAEINIPILTDTKYLFTSVTDANNFFQSFTVDDADVGSAGVVMQAEQVSYSVISSFDETDYITQIIEGNSYDLPVKAVTDELQTKLQALSVAFNTLLTKLRSAGILDS